MNMPNAILDSMDRAQALACIYPDSHNANGGRFVFDKTVYTCPENIGLPRIACIASQSMCANCLRAAINAYYDANDAASKPKWVEPEVILMFHDKHFDDMYYYAGCHANTKIACENARRKVSAFIEANGGTGQWRIMWSAAPERFEVDAFEAYFEVGALSCATRELAEAVIEKYPDELRLLMG